MLKQKIEGSPHSNVTVSITDQSINFCLGIPMNYNYGVESDDTAVMSEYVIIS